LAPMMDWTFMVHPSRSDHPARKLVHT
jgi:hypothetical protein